MVMANQQPLSRRGRMLCMLGLTAALLSPNAATTGVAHQQDDADDPPLDLAAMALTPDDLAKQDLEGYRVRASEYLDVETTAARSADDLDVEESDLLDELEDAGLLFTYDFTLDLVDPDDPELVTTNRVRTYISQHADANGAEAGFELRENEPADADSEDIRDAPEVGDESELTRFSGFAEDSVQAYLGLDLTFRTGPIYAGVQVITFGQDIGNLEDPDVEVLEALTNRLLERIEEGLDSDTSNLGTRVLRLESEDPHVFTIQDYYEIRGGVAYSQVGAPEDVVTATEDVIDEFDVLDRYRLEQAIQVGSAPSAKDPYVVIRVSRFEDEDVAAHWLDGAIERLDDTGFYADVAEVEDIDAIGDDAVAATYSFEYDESTTVEGHVVFVQVGDLGVQIEVDGVALDPLMALAEEQVSCVEEAGCLEPSAIPDTILSEISGR